MMHPLRIGLLAEGETELGSSVPYVVPQDGGKPIDRDQEGALHTLIRRELDLVGISDCEFIQRHPNVKESRKDQVTMGYTVAQPKYVKKAVVTWTPKGENDVDLVVIVIDSDADIEKRRQEINIALSAVKVSHCLDDDTLIEDQNAGGLAIRNFETWLLADSDALKELFNTELDSAIQDLENLPTDSTDPLFSKNIFDSLLEQSGFRGELSANKRGMVARWELAKIIDLDAIKSNCPEGYGRFVDDLVVAAKNAVEAQKIS